MAQSDWKTALREGPWLDRLFPILGLIRSGGQFDYAANLS
jgi:hypothetical protein